MANYTEHLTVRIDEKTNEKINLFFKKETDKNQNYKIRKQDALRKILEAGINELEKTADHDE